MYVSQNPITPQIIETAGANPSGTTSATKVMMGIATSITIQYSTRIRIVIYGDYKNGTSGNGAQVSIRYSTGTAPVNGAALTGTAAGGSENMVAAANNQRVPFSLTGIGTGLTVGTTYWVDLAMAATIGGTATAANVAIIVIEE